jgi:tyrosine-protein kinase Etk/Wzc
MNATSQVNMQNSLPEDQSEVNFAEYFDIIIDSRWLISVIALVALVAGGAYALFARPIYESNLMVQVEDSEKSAGSFLGDAASSLFDVKTPEAVENTKLFISARPRYIPIVGAWMARKSSELSSPGFMGISGFVSGAERITVPQFDVPQELEGSSFILSLEGDGIYTLTNSKLDGELKGLVGKLLDESVAGGRVKLLVSAVDGKKGAQFELVRYSKQYVLNLLQDELKVVEKGKQSGVIDVSWQSPDPEKLTHLLREIGQLYVRQNVDRKAAEAEKTLGFLDTELPKFKSQLEQSEDVYNRYRNQNGTVSLDDEAKNALTQTVDLQSKLIDAQQRRRELLSRFTEKHPSVQTLDAQIAAWNSQISAVDAQIRKMPMLQQSTLRMQRDIKVNTDLYVSLLNSSLQMRLAKEGKVGNVRLLDDAVVPEEAVKPRKSLVILASLGIGLFIGLVSAILKNTFFGGIKNPAEIEAHTGLSVYSSIPLSEEQRLLDKNVNERLPGSHVLAINFPEDPAVESLRSLRTALQFAMLEAPNNRILISGGTPGVGKSFVSVNFAATVAASGKRVLLIDADLRKGHINQVFSLGRPGGLSEIIAGSKSFDQVIRKAVLPNLDLITTGVLPPNPAELLMSDSFHQILESSSINYDIVIIDTAPVLVASDTAAVAPYAGTVLLVARSERTQLGELNESAKRLAHAGSTVNGVILNAMDMTKRHYGSYGYKYGGYKYTQYKYQHAKQE